MSTEKPDFLRVVPVDTECELIGSGSDPLIGRIRAIRIERQDHVSYEVAWFSGTTRVTAWLGGDEIAVRPSGLSFRKIGFATTGREQSPLSGSRKPTKPDIVTFREGTEPKEG